MPRGGKRDGAGRKLTGYSDADRKQRKRERQRLELAALDPVERLKQQVRQLKEDRALWRGRYRVLMQEFNRLTDQQIEDIRRVGDDREELRREVERLNAELAEFHRQAVIVPFPK